MFKTNQILSVMGILLGVTLGGCGSQNLDPLDVGGPIPTLNSITAQTGNINSYLQAPGFTASNPYWTFGTTFGGFAGNYVAPAAGVVTEIGSASLSGVQGYFVTIVHSGGLATRLYGLQTVTLRTGDSVLAGQVIAQYYLSSQVSFQVLYKGVPVCPLSYLSTQFRQSIYNYNSSQLCQ